MEYICILCLSFSAVESRLKTDPELKKKLLSVAANLQEGQNSPASVLSNLVDHVLILFLSIISL